MLFPNLFSTDAGSYKNAAGKTVSLSHHARGINFVKDTFWPKSMFGKVFGMAMLGYSAYTGYQEDGVWGAAKSVSKDLALTYLMGRVPPPLAIGIGAASAVVGTAAMAYGGATGIGMRQMARPMVKQHVRKHIGLEMGTASVDQYGTGATMRQRSLAAIQGSRINGRSGLGNEAFLMQQSYWR